VAAAYDIWHLAAQLFSWTVGISVCLVLAAKWVQWRGAGLASSWGKGHVGRPSGPVRPPQRSFFSGPSSSAAASSPAWAAPELAIEARLPVDLRKTLLVVRCGHERFLMSATPETLTFVTKLAPPALPLPDTAASAEDANPLVRLFAEVPPRGRPQH
jgi:hypothetical protein